MTCPSPEARISREIPACGTKNRGRLQAHRRFLPRQLQGEAVHAARPLRAQGLDGSSAGSGWITARAGELAVGLGRDPLLHGVSQVPREMTRADMEKVVADFKVDKIRE